MFMFYVLLQQIFLENGFIYIYLHLFMCNLVEKALALSPFPTHFVVSCRCNEGGGVGGWTPLLC